jgi:hypothetical protein
VRRPGAGMDSLPAGNVPRWLTSLVYYVVTHSASLMSCGDNEKAAARPFLCCYGHIGNGYRGLMPMTAGRGMWRDVVPANRDGHADGSPAPACQREEDTRISEEDPPSIAIT